MNKVKLFTPSLLILTVLVIGGMAFKFSTPSQCTEILPHDNIFVLTGDMRRIPFAVRQMHAHPGSNLYIIGVGGDASYTSNDRISIESDSKSTYQNARAIRKIADAHNINRLVIITTEDHMNRARYLIRREMPKSTIIACPVPLTDMPTTKRLERWGIEYIKYIATLMGINES